MDSTGGAAGVCTAARGEIEAACQFLVDPTPENLDRCGLALSRAVARLQERPLSTPERTTLRESVQRAGKLLELAGAYHSRWQRVLRAQAGGYTPNGDAAALAVAGRVWLQG